MDPTSDAAAAATAPESNSGGGGGSEGGRAGGGRNSLFALWNAIMTRSPVSGQTSFEEAKEDSLVAQELEAAAGGGEFINIYHPSTSGRNTLGSSIASVEPFQSGDISANPQDRYWEIQRLQLELEAKRLDMEERRLEMEAKRLEMYESMEGQRLQKLEALATKRLQVYHEVETRKLEALERLSNLRLQELELSIKREEEELRLQGLAAEQSVVFVASPETAATAVPSKTGTATAAVPSNTATPAVTSRADTTKEKPVVQVQTTEKTLVIFHSYCWRNSVAQIKDDLDGNRITKQAYDNAMAQAGILDPRTVRDWLDAAGYETWLDVRKLDDGGQLFDQLCEAIAQSTLMLAFISDDYARSENCKKEWFYAQGVVPVIPVIIGAPPEPEQKPYWQDSKINFDMNNMSYIDARTGDLDGIKQKIIEAVQRELSKLEQAGQNS